jgi:acetamidase/formamidase
VAVRGAKAGQVLQVDIEAIELNYDWGYNTIRPLAGALPDDFAASRLIHIPLDRTRMTGRLPWGLELALKPFFGVMVVAPPHAWGAVGWPPPRRNGGNMDNKELVAGTTLFVPVFAKGALFEVGDGHVAQGDGEVDQTAIETSLRGRIQLTVRKGLRLNWPRAETATDYISMAADPDLTVATKTAIQEMVDFLAETKHLSKHEAYQLVSVAGNVAITQLVDKPNVGVHVRMPKSIFK